MHMADALLSPAVGATMWAATAGTIAWCARRVKHRLDDCTIPLMGVLGAFVFAAQMINFTIPATGSSGHLGGGLLLAILLGPCAAFLTIASVLSVQALFFADGGLLALGCNIFNLGVFPCFVAWPIYRHLAGQTPSAGRIAAGSITGAVIALQLGALAVVLETVLSGVSDLPFRPFLLLMQPIHLAIGVVEGVVTALVVGFIWRARPEILQAAYAARPPGTLPVRNVVLGVAAVAVLIGGILSWFASTHPDGLEWSIAGVTGSEELQGPVQGVHWSLARMQEKTTLLPEYGFRTEAKAVAGAAPGSADHGGGWPSPELGTSISGFVGGLLTLVLVAGIGLVLKRWPRRRVEVQ